MCLAWNNNHTERKKHLKLILRSSNAIYFHTSSAQTNLNVVRGTHLSKIKVEQTQREELQADWKTI